MKNSNMPLDIHDIASDIDYLNQINLQFPERGERLFVSPLARRIAHENGIDVSLVKVSCSRVRVVQEDVIFALRQRDEKIHLNREYTMGENGAEHSLRSSASLGNDNISARSTLRRFDITFEYEIDEFLSLCTTIKDFAPLTTAEHGGDPAFDVSTSAMFIRAVALALQSVRLANASWNEGSIVYHTHSDICVELVLLTGVVLTPVIRQVETKSISVLSNEIVELCGHGALQISSNAEYGGFSTLISFCNASNCKHYFPALIQTHCAAIGVGSIAERAVVKDGNVNIARTIGVTLSADPRIMDSSIGSNFMNALKFYLDRPIQILA